MRNILFPFQPCLACSNPWKCIIWGNCAVKLLSKSMTSVLASGWIHNLGVFDCKYLYKTNSMRFIKNDDCNSDRTPFKNLKIELHLNYMVFSPIIFFNNYFIIHTSFIHIIQIIISYGWFPSWKIINPFSCQIKTI